MWLRSTNKRRRYLVDHEYTLLGFLSAGNAELEVKDESLEEGKTVFLFGLTSSDVGHLDRSIPKESWKSARKSAL